MKAEKRIAELENYILELKKKQKEEKIDAIFKACNLTISIYTIIIAIVLIIKY